MPDVPTLSADDVEESPSLSASDVEEQAPGPVTLNARRGGVVDTSLPKPPAPSAVAPTPLSRQERTGTSYQASPTDEGADVRLGRMVPDAAVGPLETTEKALTYLPQKGGQYLGRAAERAVATAVTPRPTPAFRDKTPEPLTDAEVETAREQHPYLMGAAKGVGETVGSTVADPLNWPFFASGMARPILQRIISLGFTGMLTKGTVDAAQQLHDNWDKLTPEQRMQLATQAGLSGLMAAGGLYHATNPRLGVAITPEETRIRAGINPLGTGVLGVEARIPRAPEARTPTGTALEPPTIEGQIIPPPTRAEAAEYLDRANFDENKARELYRQDKAAQVAPPPAETPSASAAPRGAVSLPAPVTQPVAQPVTSQVPKTETAPVKQIEKPSEPEKPAALPPVPPAPKVPARAVQNLSSAEVEEAGAGGVPEPAKYKFGSTQANIPAESEASKALESARARISGSDLAGDGKDIGAGGNHVTVRYGIKGDDTEKIKQYLSSLVPFEATLGKTDKFPPSEHSDGAAVIVAPIDAPELHRINEEIQQHGDFAESSFPEYKPHATVAYVKPEVADRYVGMDVTAGKKFTVNEIAITDKQGKQEVVQLGGAQARRITSGTSPTGSERRGRLPIPAEHYQPTGDQGQPIVPAAERSGEYTPLTEEQKAKLASAKGREAKRSEREILGLPPKPGEIGNMQVRDLKVAPHKFQYKLATDSEGVGTLLKETRVFNPDLAGIISVWRDPADGKTYVVNGHHRYELAKRLGQNTVAVRHIVAPDAIAARAIGAMQNIAEGRGTAVDAAKFFRDTRTTPEDLAAKGVSLGEATARQGLALSRLDTPIFNKVVSGEMRVGRGVAIGEATADPAEQKAILQLVDKRERGGGKVSDSVLSELIRLVKESGQTTESTADLFGAQEISRSLALEKAEISDYIKQQLAKDKKLFGFVAKEARAQELARAGNKINVTESGRISTEAAQSEEVYNKLSSRGGPIASILESSARRLADGENGNTVKADAYREVRAEVSRTLGQAEGRDVERPQAAPAGGESAQGETGQPEKAVDKNLFSLPKQTERYVWMRNKEGGQPVGGQMEIRPLDEQAFQEHVKGRISVPANNLAEYQALFPQVTHYAMAKPGHEREWKFTGIGPLNYLRPQGEAKQMWAKKVDSFDSPEAQAWMKTADSDVYQTRDYLDANYKKAARERVEADLAKKVKDSQGNLFHVEPAPAFYSKAARIAFDKLPQAGSGQSFLATLKNAGVKEDEIKWIGLDDLLKDKPKVSKREVLTYIMKNMVQVKEVSLGAREPVEQATIDEARDKATQAQYHFFGVADSSVGLQYDALVRDVESAISNENQSTDAAIQEFYKRTFPGEQPPPELLKAAQNYATTDREFVRLRRTAPQRPAKYEAYTLPGDKKNYTELLLTLPSAPRKVMDTIAKEKGWGGWTSDLTEEQKQEVIRAFDAQPSERPQFNSAHFDEPNILAHVRFDQRTDADGKPMLFIEEVQSDWHQKGKKIGYQKRSEAGELAKASAEVLTAGKASQEARNKLFPLLKQADDLGYDSTSEVADDIGTGRLLPENIDEAGVPGLREAASNYRNLRKLWESALQRSDAMESPRGAVPDAPFKSDWHELAMKRMLRYAAERGYDRIGWVTGQQTADRYDLSKHITSIMYDPHRMELFVVRKGNDRYENITRGNTVEPESLPEYIGKDAAEKLLKAEPNPNGDLILKSVDLTVGGEWAKRLYDQAIPNFLSKYGKKWNAKVGEAEIGGRNDDTASTVDEINALGWGPFVAPEGRPWAVWSNQRGDVLGWYATKEIAEDHIQTHPGTKVHSLSITPEMKASVMYEGQPLFHPPTGPIQPGDASKIDFQVVEPGKGLPRYIRLNGPALSLVNRAMGVQFGGVSMAPDNVFQIEEHLEGYARNLENRGFREPAKKIRYFANMLRTHTAENDGLTLVAAARNPADEIRIIEEELIHAIQRRHGKGDLEKGLPVDELIEHPVFQKMGRQIGAGLEAAGVRPHPESLVAEGGMQLVTGRSLSVTPEEAQVGTQRYSEALADKHGIQPLEEHLQVLDYAKQLREASNVELDRDRAARLRSAREGLTRVVQARRGKETAGSSGAIQTGQGAGRPGGNKDGDFGGGTPGPAYDRARSGQLERRSRSDETTPAFAAAHPGLTDEELAEWSKSRGFRTEDAGEQLGMFGGNDKLLRAFRIGPRGKQQAGLIYQSQLDKLREQQSLAPTEPFALTNADVQEEQPRLFGAGDLGEVIGSGKSGEIQLPQKEKAGGESLFSGTSGSFTPIALNPQRIQQQYTSAVNEFLGKHKLQDKYFHVRQFDPEIADALQLVDNAPRYLREKAQANVNQVTKGLSENQIRLASMMVDSDSRDYLRNEKPDEYEEAENDPKVMDAVNAFQPLQEELTQDRQALGWPVRKSLAVEENLEAATAENRWLVKDRDGNPVADFKTQGEASQYVEDNAEIEPHLKRTYPEHSRNPLPADTGAGPFTGTFYADKGLRPPKMDKKARLKSAEYFYQHGRKDFSGYIESYQRAKEAMMKQQLFDDFSGEATKWKAGTAQPPEITYRGKTYYRPDIVLKAKQGGETLAPYSIYDPSRGERFLIRTEDWSTWTTGKPGIGPNDRWLGPKTVVDALENYDASRGGEGAGKMRKFFQEQIVGLFGPVVHMNNILRHAGQFTGTGAFDPRSWSSLRKIIFDKSIREKVLKGVDDATVDWLTQHGHYTDWRDIGNLNAYIGGNLNPFNWVRAFGKNVLFNPKFAGGWGGWDPKARVVLKQWLDDHAPQMTDQQKGQAIDDALGEYNRANWTERQRQIARFCLFPGWDIPSARWFLKHPWKVGFAGAAVVLAANYLAHRLGFAKGEDWKDMGYLHLGDRKYRTGLISDSMGQHFAQPILSGVESAMKGEEVPAGAEQGYLRGLSGLAGQFSGPAVEMLADQLFNRKYAGGSQEIVKPEDKNIPGTWAPNLDIEKRISFSVAKGFPALSRFLTPQGEWDWKQGLGSAVGVSNYKYGAEERLKANVAKSMGYSQTLSVLAQRDPDAAEKYVSDPNKALYLAFHSDLDQAEKDLKDLDKEVERVKMAGDLSQKERKQTLADLDESRKQILVAADQINQALVDAKLGAKKAAGQ